MSEVRVTEETMLGMDDLRQACGNDRYLIRRVLQSQLLGEPFVYDVFDNANCVLVPATKFVETEFEARMIVARLEAGERGHDK